MTTKTAERSGIRLASATELHQSSVDAYRAARAAGGVNLTRKQARAEIERRKAEQAKAEAEKLVATITEEAKRGVDEALGGFVAVADMLRAVADGDQPYRLDATENARIILAYFEKHATTLERALFQLQAWEGAQVEKKTGGAVGHFADRLFRIE